MIESYNMQTKSINSRIALTVSISACLLIPTLGATYQLSCNFDNSFFQGDPPPPGTAPTFSTTVEAPYVGSMTLSYEAENSLADGTHTWESLATTLVLSVNFPSAGRAGETVGVNFNQTHLTTPAQDVRIQVVGGNFFFTNINTNGSSPDQPHGSGSANFFNNSYLFTTQPLYSETRMGFGGYVVDYNALYQLVDKSTASTDIEPGQPGFSSGTTIYRGNYGNPTANVVPEVSSVLMGCLGALGLLRRNRR